MTGRILSGIQPTNNLHLGNYLGALKNWVAMQSEYECLYCVVDLHAITVPQDPEELRANTVEAAAAYIACGVDPDTSKIFVQSHVPAHSELAWLLGCNTPMGWLNRMTQFKEKSGKHKDKAGLGLYAYPVLMAADILIYHATHVPVGDDQKQHVELTRDIAESFNHHYQEYLTVPEPVIPKAGARVMSLRDGTAKMSKSAESDMTRINLTDDADLIAQKIKKAKTDPDPLPDSVEGLDGRPEAANLVGIYAALLDTTHEEVIAQFAGKQFSEFKPALADLCVEKMGPITTRMNELMNDRGEIENILSAGAEKANAIAETTVSEVRQVMGFWSSGDSAAAAQAQSG